MTRNYISLHEAWHMKWYGLHTFCMNSQCMLCGRTWCLQLCTYHASSLTSASVLACVYRTGRCFPNGTHVCMHMCSREWRACLSVCECKFAFSFCQFKTSIKYMHVPVFMQVGLKMNNIKDYEKSHLGLIGLNVAIPLARKVLSVIRQECEPAVRQPGNGKCLPSTTFKSISLFRTYAKMRKYFNAFWSRKKKQTKTSQNWILTFKPPVNPRVFSAHKYFPSTLLKETVEGEVNSIAQRWGGSTVSNFMSPFFWNYRKY